MAAVEPPQASRWGKLPATLGPRNRKPKTSTLSSFKVELDFDTKAEARKGGIFTAFTFPSGAFGRLCIIHMGQTSDSLFVVRALPSVSPPQGMRYADTSNFRISVCSDEHVVTAPHEGYLVTHSWTIRYSFNNFIADAFDAANGVIARLNDDTGTWTVDRSAGFETNLEEMFWSVDVQRLEGGSEWAVLIPDGKTDASAFLAGLDGPKKSSWKPVAEHIGSWEPPQSDDVSDTDTIKGGCASDRKT